MDDDIASLIIFYSATEERPCVLLQWRCGGGKFLRGKTAENIKCPCAFVLHDNRRGYTFEYAIEWDMVQMTPPKNGECRANTWNIHFSDADGVACTGQIVENVFPGAAERLGPDRFTWLYQSHLWGKAVFTD